MGLGSGERGGFVHEFSIQGISTEHLSEVRGGRRCAAKVGLDISVNLTLFSELCRCEIVALGKRSFFGIGWLE